MEPQHDTTPELTYEPPVIEASDDIEGLLGGKIS